MSFSADTKAELCRAPLNRSCCAAAEAYGILLYANTFSGREIRIITGSPALSARLPKLFARVFGLEFDVLPRDNASGKRSFRITDSAKIQKIFSTYGQEPGLALHINFGMLENDCCRSAFLRGAFLSGGSVTDPDKRYHLELLCSHKSVLRETTALLQELGFEPRSSHRGANELLYFKQSDIITDLLSTLGAPLSGMALQQSKVEKDMRNTINRRVNCDSANADRIVSAAQEQLDMIRRIEEEIGLTELPEALQDTAMLRIANPESSLSELSALSFPPVSKSCLSHRMKKLMSYLDDVKREGDTNE